MLVIYDSGSSYSVGEPRLASLYSASIDGFNTILTSDGWLNSLCTYTAIQIRSVPLYSCCKPVITLPVMCVDLPIFHTYRAQTEDKYKYLILGLDHAHLFPDPVDRQGLWAPYAKRYPGLRWNTSRVTGRGILMG